MIGGCCLGLEYYHGDADVNLKIWLCGDIQKRRHSLSCFVLSSVFFWYMYFLPLSRYNDSVSKLNMLITPNMLSQLLPSLCFPPPALLLVSNQPVMLLP